MKKKTQKNVLNDEIKKIMYKSNYSINETPRYKELIDDDFDEVPQQAYATQDGFPMPNVGGSEAYLEEDDENADELPGAPELAPKKPAEPTNAETPNDLPKDVDVDELPMEDPTEEPVDVDKEVDIDVDVSAEETPLETEKEVDEIQNEIIKHNIEAMKGISTKMNDLDSYLNNINQQLTLLNDKVEEVEEPTSAEKLMQQKDVSYPYYFNLNDFWNGSFFTENREKENEKGIRELPDGTFIADFDDLPTNSDMDVKDSFNNIV